MKISARNFCDLVDKLISMNLEPKYFSYVEFFINRKSYEVHFTETEVYLNYDP